MRILTLPRGVLLLTATLALELEVTDTIGGVVCTWRDGTGQARWQTIAARA